MTIRTTKTGALHWVILSCTSLVSALKFTDWELHQTKRATMEALFRAADLTILALFLPARPNLEQTLVRAQRIVPTERNRETWECTTREI